MAGGEKRSVGLLGRSVVAVGVAVVVALLAALTVPGGSAQAERVLRAGMVISFDGGINPTVLDRRRPQPIKAHLSGRVRALDGGPLPRLERLQIEINRNAIVTTQGLPVCRLGDIQNALVDEAMRNCRDSLIGGGYFGVQIALPDQDVGKSKGRAFAFHSRIGRRRAVLMHIVTAEPAAVSITLPFVMHRQRRGDFGLRLVSPSMSRIVNHYIFTTDFSFSLGRTYKTPGGRKSYLSAACRAPRGFNGGIFNLARATYVFSDGRRVRQSLVRNCRVAGG